MSPLATNLAFMGNFLDALIMASCAASLDKPITSNKTLHFLTNAV